MKSQWKYDETTQVGTDYLNEKEILSYDQRMQLLRNICYETNEIVRDLGILKNSVIWEIGTGTGECAIALSRVCKQVYATDVSETMLSYARLKADNNKRTNIIFENGGFLSGFQPPVSVDFIVSQLVFHHLPDFWKSQALSVIASRLKPKGKLYLKDVVFPSEIDDYESFFNHVIEVVRVKAGDEMAQETVLHIKEEYSTLDWILEGMIKRNGFKILKNDNQGFLSVYICEK